MGYQIDFISIDDTSENIVIDNDDMIDDASLVVQQQEIALQEQDGIPADRVLWDGIFWFEACLAVRRSMDWFQLNTIIDGVREEALVRAGILVRDEYS